MEDVLRELLQDDKRTLVFALGSKARTFFEEDLGKSDEEFNSINSLVRAKENIKVLFLDKLQYLFMYLTNIELELFLQDDLVQSPQYDEVVIFGIEFLLEIKKADIELTPDQIRKLTLICTASFRLQKKYKINVRYVWADETGKTCRGLGTSIRYWQYVYSE